MDELASLEFAKKSRQIGFTSPGLDFEDAVVFEITEGGAKSLPFVESVFVDSENQGALERDAFGGLAPGELPVDTLDSGLAEPLSSSNRSGADSLVMLLEDGLAIGLGSVPAFHDPGEVWDERAATGEASKSAGFDEQPGGFLEAIQMPDFAKIPSFALNT